MAQAQAGTVMGGVMLSSSPYMLPAMSFEMLGTSSAIRSNSSAGVPQSRPITATRGPSAIETLLLVAKRSAAARGAPVTAFYPLRGWHDSGVVDALRRVLYFTALVWGMAGVLLSVFPRFF